MQNRNQTDKPAQPDYEDRLVAINYPTELIPTEYLGIISLEVVNNPLLICTGYTCLIEKDNLLKMWASSANKKKFHPIGLEKIPEHSIKTVPHLENAIIAFVERQEQIHRENPPSEVQEIFQGSQLMERHIAKKIFEYNKQINLREFYIEELNILLGEINCDSKPPQTISAALIDRIKSLLGYSQVKPSIKLPAEQPAAAAVTDLIEKIELISFKLNKTNNPDPYIRQKQIYQLIHLGLTSEKMQQELNILLERNATRSPFMLSRTPVPQNKLYFFSAANLYDDDRSLSGILRRINQEKNHESTFKPGGIFPED